MLPAGQPLIPLTPEQLALNAQAKMVHNILLEPLHFAMERLNGELRKPSAQRIWNLPGSRDSTKDEATVSSSDERWNHTMTPTQKVLSGWLVEETRLCHQRLRVELRNTRDFYRRDVLRAARIVMPQPDGMMYRYRRLLDGTGEHMTTRIEAVMSAEDQDAYRQLEIIAARRARGEPEEEDSEGDSDCEAAPVVLK